MHARMHAGGLAAPTRAAAQRLGQFVIIEAPWYFHAFFKAISPFIDKVLLVRARGPGACVVRMSMEWRRRDE